MTRHIFLILLAFLCSIGSVATEIDEAWVKSNYTKTENMVPMRDGIRLYTAVYQPDDTLSHPVLMYRSTYGSGPYGEEFNKDMWGALAPYAERRYIIVKQDVRGQRMSEGEFENVRPVHIYNDKGANDVTDVYDTADWLLANTNSNGNIGVAGNSYLGFTAFTAALSGHKAIKAVCPQAPIGDWFMGDDFHHNGAFMPSHSFSFLSGFGQKRHAPTTKGAKKHNFYSDDEYSFYLRNKSIPSLSRFLGDSIPFWNKLVEHPDYDSFWTERNPLNHIDTVHPAVLVVGGWYDAEDLYGALLTWNELNAKSPSTESFLLMGPWSHGGWRGSGKSLGALRFGSPTGDKFKELQLQFFEHYLNGKEKNIEHKVNAFSSGDNTWHSFTQWPPAQACQRELYLNSDRSLDFSARYGKSSYSQYHSNPLHPVPHTREIAKSTGGGYMYEDQRFASQRPDVITFVTEPLDSSVTIAGPVIPRIWMSSTTDDADIVVKLIDVYPEDFKYPEELKPDQYLMGGYQQLVRGDIMPARYRKSFSHPLPLTPGQPTLVEMTMPDVYHTFEKGHRIMVQVQSSWFPLFRVHPQQFVDLYKCDDADFLPADIRIYHDAQHQSALSLPVISAGN